MKAIKETIKRALKYLGDKYKIFQNEYDFAFNMRLQLQNELKDMTFFSEYRDIEWINQNAITSKKRIDLMFYNKPDNRYIIEFKYKTREMKSYKNNDGVSLPLSSNNSYNTGIEQIENDKDRIKRIIEADNSIKSGFIVFVTDVDGYHKIYNDFEEYCTLRYENKCHNFKFLVIEINK